MKANKVRKAGLWILVSDTNKPEDVCKKQKSAAKILAQIKGMRIGAIYKTRHSDLSTAMCPHVKRMIHDIQKGNIQALIIPNISMLGHTVGALANNIDFFQTYDISIISMDGNLDTSTPAGRFHWRIVHGVAQWEQEIRKESDM